MREALERLQLNDAALSFSLKPLSPWALVSAVDFGLLHMEIVQERLEREYIDIITTAPSVIYRITMNDGTTLEIDNPTNYPDPGQIFLAEERLPRRISMCRTSMSGISWSFASRGGAFL